MSEPLTYLDLAEIELTRLKGLGPTKEKALRKVGVTNVLELLTHYPRRYLDRTKESRLADLAVDEAATVLVTIRSSGLRRMRNRRTMVEAVVGDDSGSLRLVFFNQPWREKQLTPGSQCLIFGKVKVRQGKREMTNPVVDLIGDKTGRIVPIYPQSEKAGLDTWEIGAWVANALGRCTDRGFADPVPPGVRAEHGFVDRGTALVHIHDPPSFEAKQEARRRLVFDELFRLQVSLVLRKRAIERSAQGVEHDVGGSLVARFHDGLPFPLTAAQRRTIDEIVADLAEPVPMHRLLQGDVGSGKTVVALSALLTAVQGGHQGAFMAPTEVVAEQHHLSVQDFLGDLAVPDDGATIFGERPLGVALLTGRTSAGERARIADGLADGSVDLLIGTHALIEDGIAFRSLGMVVIDEQHKFGVEQRAALRTKGAGTSVPDVLVMTATPIPRTAAMTVYGDLDVSTLDELPPGRSPVETVWLPDAEAEAWDRVRAEVTGGRQAFVVCPLIEESDKLEARSAEQTHARLIAGELTDIAVGLLHGRMTPAEKAETMHEFRGGRLPVLVATTVVEVGVDVPRATVMVVIDADRFGLAQLHQLRGRVGRGRDPGWCYLLGDSATPEGSRRLEAMEKTTDGFVLAETDLEIRGEGTILGERQKGMSDLKLARLQRDEQWIVAARRAAVDLVDADPGLEGHAVLLAEIEHLLDEDAREFLLKG